MRIYVRPSGYAALVLAVAATAACSGATDASNADKGGDEPKPAAAQSSAEPAETREASCVLKGSRAARVRLVDGDDALVATFTGQPVADKGTTGYFVTVFDDAGDHGAQLGITYRDGNPEGYFVFDVGTSTQENLDGEATVDGDTVTGEFPKSAKPLGDFDVGEWNATFAGNGSDLGKCPKNEFLQPFPS